MVEMALFLLLAFCNNALNSQASPFRSYSPNCQDSLIQFVDAKSFPNLGAWIFLITVFCKTSLTIYSDHLSEQQLRVGNSDTRTCNRLDGHLTWPLMERATAMKAKLMITGKELLFSIWRPLMICNFICLADFDQTLHFFILLRKTSVLMASGAWEKCSSWWPLWKGITKRRSS